MKNKGKRFTPGKSGVWRPKSVRTARGSFKRDEDFRGFLARELDMESPPPSFDRAMRRVYAELPRDMPVRHYPLRSALKGLATVAVVLVIFGISLLGANSVYPQLTESLPGVGMLFKTVNGTTEDSVSEVPEQVAVPSQPAETETETQTPLEEKEAYTFPAFDPVKLSSSGDTPGELTVENAWSDGKKLYLDISILARADYLEQLSKPDWAVSEYLPEVLFFFPCEDVFSYLFESAAARGKTYDTDLSPENPGWLSSIFINGAQVDSALEVSESPVLQYSEENGALALHFRGVTTGMQSFARYTGSWVLEVPQDARDTQSSGLAVSLNLQQALYHAGDVRHMAWSGLSFQGDFTMAVDSAGAVELACPEPDNGVTITEASYTPAMTDITLNVPFLGYYGDSLLTPNLYHGGVYENIPYGMYAVLSEEDGTVLSAQNLFEHNHKDAVQVGQLGEEDLELEYQDMSFQANIPARKRDSLRLTLYQFDPDALQPSLNTVNMEKEELYNQVVAEFTLHPAEGTITASRYFTAEGLTRLDAGTSLAMSHHPAFENGVYVQAVGEIPTYDWHMELVSLCVEWSQETGIPDWALICYSGGEVAQTVYACDLADPEYGNATLFETNEHVYAGGGGFFWQKEEQLYENDRYIHIYFAAEYPSWMFDGSTPYYDTMQLVNMETGEVLIEDVKQSCLENLTEILTGSIYRLTSSDAEMEE